MSSNSGTSGNTYDVVVVGGGPAGSTVATLLAQRGVRVAVYERERFPRFQVGESLLPANLPIFDRLGCHDVLRQAGFIVKPGATFYDEYEGRGCKTIAFEKTAFQPGHAYNVIRAQFDSLLLQHAARTGAEVYYGHTVTQVHFQPDLVRLAVRGPHDTTQEARSAVLIDASGRAALVAGRLGKRRQLPGLGRVALFAHYRGIQRETTIPEGNIRIHVVPHGWLWCIPFADGTDSLGCVLHARIAKERQGSIEELFDTVTHAVPLFAARLAGAQRVTSVYTAANFSYRAVPMAGDRYLAIGDAAGFVDPIFSSGVYVAMHSAELAAKAVWQALQEQDFRARRFRVYETRLSRDMAPFFAFIKLFYDPAFLDLFFAPQPPQHLYRAVLWVLNGAAVDHRHLWVRTYLAMFFAAIKGRKALRWLAGLPAATRWHW